jgi:hypothetical protein
MPTKLPIINSPLQVKVGGNHYQDPATHQPVQLSYQPYSHRPQYQQQQQQQQPHQQAQQQPHQQQLLHANQLQGDTLDGLHASSENPYVEYEYAMPQGSHSNNYGYAGGYYSPVTPTTSAVPPYAATFRQQQQPLTATTHQNSHHHGHHHRTNSNSSNNANQNHHHQQHHHQHHHQHGAGSYGNGGVYRAYSKMSALLQSTAPIPTTNLKEHDPLDAKALDAWQVYQHEMNFNDGSRRE